MLRYNNRDLLVCAVWHKFLMCKMPSVTKGSYADEAVARIEDREIGDVQPDLIVLSSVECVQLQLNINSISSRSTLRVASHDLKFSSPSIPCGKKESFLFAAGMSKFISDLRQARPANNYLLVYIARHTSYDVSRKQFRASLPVSNDRRGDSDFCQKEADCQAQLICIVFWVYVVEHVKVYRLDV